MRILYKRILVAVDDTDRSFKSMQYASVFKDSELVVLYTVIPVDEEEIPDNVQITLDKISDYLKNKNINFISPPPILSLLKRWSPINLITYIVIKAKIADKILLTVNSKPNNDKYNIIIIIQDDAIISSNIIMYSISLIITTIKDDIKIKLIINSFVKPNE